MKAGRKFRDIQGDTWTAQDDGTLMLDESATYNEPLFHSLTELEAEYGPIRPVGNSHDPVNHPQHYMFPGGHEVINISEWLTSNAGQAVQYLARACRTDGNVKGNQLEDVRKALVFVEREISRIQSQSAHDLLR